MGILVDNYKKLLIVQYADKPKAKQTIETFLGELEKVYELANEFDEAFDLDLAVGKQLDILGKIVGLSRRVKLVIPKKYFGLNGSFGDKFEIVESYPFKDKFEPAYSDVELNDYDYRFFLRAKISKNYAKATMIDENKLSVQDVVSYIFEEKAYVVDKYDMSFCLYVNRDYDFDRIRYIIKLNLIPKPQGVRIREIVSYDENGTFGFRDNGSAIGFGDKFGENVGYFAKREIL